MKQSKTLASKSFINLANNQWGNAGTYDNRYYNAFEYDANGNIESQIRHTESGLKIEDMTYQYQKDGNGNLLRNRLYHINDAVAAGVWADDIDDMGAFTTGVTINTANNYSFDEEGRLIRDVQEEIELITWRVDGKVKEVIRVDTSSAKNLSFDYDAMGRRIAKHVYNNQTGLLEKTTYYLLDALGHTMNIYEQEVTDTDVLYTLKEQHIYGSSSLGIKMDTLNMFTTTFSNNVSTVLGRKYYHLSNHLSNNLTTINDIKIPVSTGTTVDYYNVGIVNIYDYSPFGVMLDGRTMESDFVRVSFNGMERDDEVKGRGNSYDFGARMLDSRVGRWLTRDASEAKYPAQSSYNFCLNSPLLYKDPDGNDAIVTVEKKNGATTYVFSSTIYLTGKGVDEEYVQAVRDYYEFYFKDNYFESGMTDEDGSPINLKIDLTFVNASADKSLRSSGLPDEVVNYANSNAGMENHESIKRTENEGHKGGLPKGDNVVLFGGYTGVSAARFYKSQAWISEYDKGYKFKYLNSKFEISPIQRAAYGTLHEVFHLLGLSDRYNPDSKEKKSFPGYKNNVMGFENVLFAALQISQNEVLSKDQIVFMINKAQKIISQNGNNIYDEVIKNGNLDSSDPALEGN